MEPSPKSKDPNPIWGKALLQEQKRSALYYKYHQGKNDVFNISGSYLRDISKQRQQK